MGGTHREQAPPPTPYPGACFPLSLSRLPPPDVNPSTSHIGVGHVQGLSQPRLIMTQNLASRDICGRAARASMGTPRCEPLCRITQDGTEGEGGGSGAQKRAGVGRRWL